LKLFELVVDKSDLFAKKKAETFQKRLGQVMADFPDKMKSQEEQEKAVGVELTKVEQLPSVMLKSDLLKLAKLRRNWPTANLIDILLWAADGFEVNKEEEALAKEYVLANVDKLLKVIDAQQEAIKKIVIDADKQKWAVPWRRYTRYGYVVHDISLHKSALEKIKRTGKI
jgi:hypothetical protein